MNTRKEMPTAEIFDIMFCHCVEKNAKNTFADKKNYAKDNYPTTVISSTVDKSGRRINKHDPYVNETGEVQIIYGERKKELNKDAYIAKLEKEVSAKKCEQFRAECMEERNGTTTLNAKPTKAFEVIVEEELNKDLPKIKARVAKRCGYRVEDLDVDEVRQKALSMVKGQQAN